MRNTCLAVSTSTKRINVEEDVSETENSLGKARATDARKYARGHEKKKRKGSLIQSRRVDSRETTFAITGWFFSLFSSLLLQRRRKLVPATGPRCDSIGRVSKDAKSRLICEMKDSSSTSLTLRARARAIK